MPKSDKPAKQARPAKQEPPKDSPQKIKKPKYEPPKIEKFGSLEKLIVSGE